MLHDARPLGTRSGYAAIAPLSHHHHHHHTTVEEYYAHRHMKQHAAAVRTSSDNGDYFFISIYLPPAMTRSAIDAVFEQLEAWLAACPGAHIIAIADDMNTAAPRRYQRSATRPAGLRVARRIASSAASRRPAPSRSRASTRSRPRSDGNEARQAPRGAKQLYRSHSLRLARTPSGGEEPPGHHDPHYQGT